MENLDKLQKKIEAILFYKGEPISQKDLSRVLEVSEEEIKKAVTELQEKLKDRGIVLISNKDEYSLATSPDASKTIAKVVKDELDRDLSAASLETLSIIAYKSSVSRKEIEYIRGVNSSFSLRNLLLRGLIEREPNRLDERIFLYKPTTDFLLHLGIKSIEELPEWKSVQSELKKAEESEVEIREKEDKEAEE